MDAKMYMICLVLLVARELTGGLWLTRLYSVGFLLVGDVWKAPGELMCLCCAINDFLLPLSPLPG